MAAYQENFDRQIFSTLTLSMSLETRAEVAALIADTRKRILDMVRRDTRPEVAVQMNFQLFDCSKRAGDARTKKKERP